MATVIDVCKKHLMKHGKEALLALVSDKFYGFCYLDGKYHFPDDDKIPAGIFTVNVRLCSTCHYHIRQHLKEYNRKGGVKGTDPFWIDMKKKYGGGINNLLSRDGTRKLGI